VASAPAPSLLTLIGFGPLGWGGQFVDGTILTLEISASAYAVGILLGLLGVGARLSGLAPLRWLGLTYVTIVRAVPELLLIILLYYTGTTALREILVGFGMSEEIEINAFAAAVVTLGFVQGAYQTEVFRGAILSVPRGLAEAAKALALHPAQRLGLVVLPLAARYALPGMSNLWLAILKDSALISVVGFSELLFTGKTAAGGTKLYFFFFLFTAMIFLMLTIVSNVGIGALRRGAARGMSRE
jgi:His/Glu/Gln/Arg/opine family amino acid ABC transporter permease subunit